MARQRISCLECGGNDAALADGGALRMCTSLSFLLFPVLICVTMALVTAGCAKVAEDEVLLHGYALGKADQWDAARPFVREYLLDHPGDAGAHFLWGQCHLHGPTPWLEIARGEFVVTLHLLEETGQPGLLNADFNTKKLTIMAHQELARACFRQIYILAESHGSDVALRRIARQALSHVEKGLTLAPDNQELRDMREELNRQLGQEPQQQSPPRQPPASSRAAIAV